MAMMAMTARCGDVEVTIHLLELPSRRASLITDGSEPCQTGGRRRSSVVSRKAFAGRSVIVTASTTAALGATVYCLLSTDFFLHLLGAK
jgi:hypothetical protein